MDKCRPEEDRSNIGVWRQSRKPSSESHLSPERLSSRCCAEVWWKDWRVRTDFQNSTSERSYRPIDIMRQILAIIKNTYFRSINVGSHERHLPMEKFITVNKNSVSPPYFANSEELNIERRAKVCNRFHIFFAIKICAIIEYFIPTVG